MRGSRTKTTRRDAFLASLLCVLSASPAHASEPAPEDAEPATPSGRRAAEREVDSTRDGWFEVTVGTAHSFPAELIGDYDDDVTLVPTSTVLFVASYAPLWWLRIVTLYDLIAGREERTVSGVSEQRTLPSRWAAGVSWAPFHWDFGKSSRVELEGYTLMGLTIEQSPSPVPIVMGRVNLMQNRYEGVGVYLGVSYYFVIDKISVFYGVGYRF